MSDLLIGALGGSLIGGILGPVVLLFLNKKFSKNDDGTSLAQKALALSNQTMDDLVKERAANVILENRVRALEEAREGPFRLTADFYIIPTRTVISTSLRLLQASRKEGD